MKLTDSNTDAYNTALNKYMEESGKTSSNGVTQKLQSDEQYRRGIEEAEVSAPRPTNFQPMLAESYSFPKSRHDDGKDKDDRKPYPKRTQHPEP